MVSFVVACCGLSGAEPSQEAFWSFRPIMKPTVPVVDDEGWARSKIDRFVLARMRAEGLEPVSSAGRRTWIRRVTFDLTGLPPTPEEIDDFLDDRCDDAFSIVVDRLLASPRYGERWGRHWLDVARFGEEDTLGEFNVPYENAWRYRDWIVNALNQDMPYDVFVQSQIAGDLLTEQNPKMVERYGDLTPGVGLFAIGPWQYGNSVPAEARADERDDRVDVLTRGFLGLTVTCARCHDHKYDPISMEDYYALAGVFRNSAYREYPLVSPQAVEVLQDKQRKLDDAKSALEELLDQKSKELSEKLVNQLADYWVAVWELIGPNERDISDLILETGLDREQLEKWRRYLESPYRDHPYLAPWDLLVASGGSRQEARRVANEYQALVLSVIEEKERVEEAFRMAYEKRRENEKEQNKGQPQPEPRKTKLPNEYVGVEPIPKDPDSKPEPIGVSPIPRDRYNVWADLFDINEFLEDYHIKERRIVLYEGEELDRFLDGETKEKVNALRAKISILETEIPQFRFAGRYSKGPTFPYAMTLMDREDLETIRMHRRGSPHDLGDAIESRFLTALSDGAPISWSEGSGRVGLARAVAHHPLTARVVVNRIWHHHFGRGIVETPSNFGQLGSRPSHPGLLDYLAYRLEELDFSLKALHREIVLSTTYRLGTDHSADNLERDPTNQFYWRSNRRRLEVEAIRDGLLFVSGSLENQLGGPSYELTPDFRRRTLYGRVSRFKLSDSLALFDFPDPRLSAAKRMTTNSPLQRLFFLNNEFVWHQAEAFAERLRRVSAEDRVRIERAYLLLYGREAAEGDIELGLEIMKSLGGNSAFVGYLHILMSANEFLYVD